MKCLFATKFYSLIWHINEEAFGVRRRPGGSYRWQRCRSTPDEKHCNVLQAASLRCQSGGRSRAGTCFQEKHPPLPRKEKKNGSDLRSSVSCRGPAGGSHRACWLPWPHPPPEHRGRSRAGARRRMQRKGRRRHEDVKAAGDRPGMNLNLPAKPAVPGLRLSTDSRAAALSGPGKGPPRPPGA